MSAVSSFETFVLTVRGLNIACKLWNPEGSRKIIALHGWLDNAGSFDKLALLLSDAAVLAVDLAGQGLSDFRPASSTYHLWDDLVDIDNILEQMGWGTCIFLGHSRGAMLSLMYAGAFPEKVSNLLLVDGLVPDSVEINDTPLQLRKFVDGYNRKSGRKRLFNSREDAIKARSLAGNIPVDVAGILAERGVSFCDGKWFWRFDDRLKAASAVKMTDKHNRILLESIKCPLSIVLANRGMGAYDKILALKQDFSHFDWIEIDGHHHLHIDQQAVNVAAIFNKLTRASFDKP